MGRILRPYNPLVYPGGRLPGFDPSHPAAKGARFSGVALPSVINFVNLLTGTPGVQPNAPSGQLFALVDGVNGPSYRGNGAGTYVTFPGQSAANDTEFTVAAICRMNSVSNEAVFASNSNGTTGGFFFGPSNVGSPIIQEFATSGFNLPSIVIPTGVPVFIAASVSTLANKINWVIKRLDNGAVLAEITSSGLTFAAPNGTYCVGGALGNHLATSSQAAAMFAAVYMSMPQLLSWAADPWSFWYPPVRGPILFSGLKGPSGGATTLPASAGTFTLTGEAAVFENFDPTTSAGIFVLTGEPATTRIALTAAQGAFTETGEPVTFLQAALLVAAAGAFTETGQAAAFKEVLTSAAGTFAETGFAALLGAPAQALVAGGAIFTFTGFASIELLSSGWRNANEHETQWSSATKRNSNWTLEPPKVPWSQG